MKTLLVLSLTRTRCPEYTEGRCALDGQQCRIAARRPCTRFRDLVLLSAESRKPARDILQAGLAEYTRIFGDSTKPYSKIPCGGIGDHPCGLPKRLGSHYCEGCARRLRLRRKDWGGGRR